MHSALVIRPGCCEISEELLENKQKNPIMALLEHPVTWETSLAVNGIMNLGSIIVANTLQHLQYDVDYMDIAAAFGVAISSESRKKQRQFIENIYRSRRNP